MSSHLFIPFERNPDKSGGRQLKTCKQPGGIISLSGIVFFALPTIELNLLLLF
ncbi:hypothetical protein HPS174_0306 [Glaesserella parasuis 174]|nr:hypothetical protein HPS174_0306 [Glaesserella parasuis 174]